ncbi:recombinase family protein [Pseudomonas aeruginosa]
MAPLEIRHRSVRPISAKHAQASRFLQQSPRVSKADGSQSLDLQHDTLRAAGVERDNIYDDLASGGRDDRPGLTACLKSLRDGDVLVVWKLDRLGRSLAHLVNTVKELSDRKIGLRVLTGKGAQIDTTTASGRMVFGIFATLAEFERDLIRERTMAGLASARARGRKGGRKFALTKAQVRLAQAAMAQRDTSVSDLCKELGIERVTLYRYVGPKGELRDHGKHVLGLTSQLVSFRKLSHLRASSEN